MKWILFLAIMFASFKHVVKDIEFVGGHAKRYAFLFYNGRRNSFFASLSARIILLGATVNN